MMCLPCAPLRNAHPLEQVVAPYPKEWATRFAGLAYMIDRFEKEGIEIIKRLDWKIASI